MSRAFDHLHNRAAAAAQPEIIMFKNIEDVQKFSKEQLEAATATATTVSKSVQEIATEAGDYSKKSLETSAAFVEKLLGVKSVEKAIELQTDFAKTSYEGFVAQATKLGEMYSGLAKEAFKPVEAAFAKVQAATK